MKKNIIITGGSGQDAQILAKILQKKNYKVYCFYNDKKPVIQKKITYIKQNLSSKKKLDIFFSKIKPNIVIHFAAHNPSFSEISKNKFYKKNFNSTKNIFFTVFRSNQKAKFIFCSSSQIFLKTQKKVSEKSKITASTDYTKFRIESDQLMLKFKNKEKINYTNAILFNHDSIYRNEKFLLPRIVKALIKKNHKFLNYIINKNISSDFSHAEDICYGIYKIIISKHNLDKVILSSGKYTKINNIIKFLINKYNIDLKLNFKKIKINPTVVGNNNLAKKKLLWSHKKNIYIATDEIYKFFIKNLKSK